MYQSKKSPFEDVKSISGGAFGRKKKKKKTKESNSSVEKKNPTTWY